MKTKPPNILLKASWRKSILLLSQKERSDILINFFNYHEDEELVKMSKAAQLFFSTFVEACDFNNERYNNIIAKNKENAAKGGRPKKNPKKPMGFLENPENPKDKGIDKEIDKVNHKNIDTEKEKNKVIVSDSDTERDLVAGRIKETDPRFEYYWMKKFDELQNVELDSIEDPSAKDFLFTSIRIYKKLGRDNFSKLIFQSSCEETSTLMRTYELDQLIIENIRRNMVYHFKQILK